MESYLFENRIVFFPADFSLWLEHFDLLDELSRGDLLASDKRMRCVDPRIDPLLFRMDDDVTLSAMEELFHEGIGDQSRRLSFDERMQLAYDRGEASWESALVSEFPPDELDGELLERYRTTIGMSLTSAMSWCSGEIGVFYSHVMRNVNPGRDESR